MRDLPHCVRGLRRYFRGMMISLTFWLASLVSPIGSAAYSAPPVAEAAALQRCGYEVVAEYPHDRTAFTQGLFWHKGHLYEGTGQFGESRIMRVNLQTGRADLVQPHSPRDFGEGITRWGDQIIGVTWKGGRGYRWRIKDLKLLGEFRYDGEGWGVTMVGDELALSDGSSSIRFYDPATMAEKRRITVTLGGQPRALLNELETIDGKIWANIWYSDYLVRIDPISGVIDKAVDLQGLRQRSGAGGNPDFVLNGIAWDEARGRLFVTGKNWPKLFEIRVKDCAAATLAPRQAD